jgi:hypothetical protein
MEVSRLFKLLDARPFIPFEVAMENGEKIAVTHLENVVVFPYRSKVLEILVYYPEREDYSIIFPRGITALHVVPAQGSGA